MGGDDGVGRAFVPWRTLREEVVVVGSILIAVALDAWWDGRTERGALVDQLPLLVEEMEATRVVDGRIQPGTPVSLCSCPQGSDGRGGEP